MTPVLRLFFFSRLFQEKEVVSYDNVSNPVQRSSSLPMRRVNAVKPPPQAAARQSIGSIVVSRNLRVYCICMEVFGLSMSLNDMPL